MSYLVLKRIWHTGDECYYDPGDKIFLWHLSSSKIKSAVKLGLVRAIPTITPTVERRKPVKRKKVADVTKKKEVVTSMPKRKKRTTVTPEVTEPVESRPDNYNLEEI